ncbi:MAG: VanZ family protein [Gammaproteobacteria bacterium]|jgi:VanZ family protein|nr:VanZ family protein [Gammaproteobacteria bacterium]MDH5225861.1 VanZ family protein [Gammaproteobacteria bacterium]
MAGRSSHFAAPLLLAAITGLIVYVSLYPFRFELDGPTLREALHALSWQRAGRGDMLNNLLLYVPFGFCVALVIEPRWGRTAGLVAGTLLGVLLSLGLELLQASVAIRVSSLRDLALNGAGSLLGTVLGTMYHALGSRVTPQGTPRSRSAFVAMSILVLWLLERLWPLVPDPGLSQLKRAVRPLLTPHIDWMSLAGYVVGWLVVAQVIFGLVRRQRAMDVFLIVIAIVLVGRVFVGGSTLIVAEIAALALLLPLLVPISRLDDGARSTLVAVLLGVWLAWAAVRPLLASATGLDSIDAPALQEMLLRSVPPPPMLANKAFSYVSLGWLLAGAGLVPHVAAGMMVLFVLLLTMLQLGVPVPAYGWVDLLLAGLAGWIVARWMSQR